MSTNNIDQVMAGVRDSLPRLWYAIYRGCIQAGFTADQAFSLTQTFILANNSSNAIRPNSPSNEEPKDV